MPRAIEKYEEKSPIRQKRELREVLARRFHKDLRLENEIIKLGASYADKLAKGKSTGVKLEAAVRVIEIAARAIQARRNKVVADRREIEAKTQFEDVSRRTLTKEEMKQHAEELIEEIRVMADDKECSNNDIESGRRKHPVTRPNGGQTI